MPTLDEALHQAAVNLEEDLRQIDAGEVQASPFKRAVIAGVVNPRKLPAPTESGGYSVDSGVEPAPDAPQDPSQQGSSAMTLRIPT